MSSRKPLALTMVDASPGAAIADAIDHAKHVLAERAKSNPQVVAILEMDAGFTLFSNASLETAATWHERLMHRLQGVVDEVLAIGSDRYLLISLATGGLHARQIARRAMEAASAPIEVDGRHVILLSLVGAAFLSKGDDAASALQRAAVTLTEAGRRGRRLLMDQDVAHDMRPSPEPLAALVGELEDAFQNHRFRLALQPVMDARTLQVRHHEALLRVFARDRSIGLAGHLIGAAETLDMTGRLDSAVLTLASQQLARDPTLHLAVNISAASARDMDQGRRWLDQLAALGSEARRMTVELTETAAPDDLGGVLAEFAADVRRLGAAFSLDDFGSGHTSYRSLLALHPDEVKIDGCFVREVRRDPRSRAFVKSVATLAQDLGIRTVAEWVETAEDAQALTDLGIDALQGYYFGAPTVRACDLDMD